MTKEVLHFPYVLQRFQNVISDLRKGKFPNGKTQLSASRESRCEAICFPKERAALFWQNYRMVLHFLYVLQCSQNAIPDLRKCNFPNGETQFPASRKSRCETFCFPKERATLFWQIDRKVLQFLYVLQCFIM